jgi:putative spermidine/putrescine transport system substrate-binding protein
MNLFRRAPRLLRSLVLLVTFVLAGVALPTSAAGVLRVLSWPGYADADLVKVFEQRTGSTVQITFVDSDDTLWQKINQNNAQDFDVFAVNSAELQRYLPAGLVAPINTASIPNIARQLPRFREVSAIAGLVQQGKVFSVPYTYSEMGLIYDRKQFQVPPNSIEALWDPRWRGKVLLYNGSTHNFSLAAQSLGNTNPFRLDKAQWPAAVDRLIALRRNALGFYTQPDESVDMFRRRGAALMFANYGSQQVQLLKAAGVDAGYVVPKEGALAWLDGWAITRNATNAKLAHEWINYLLEPAPGQALLTRQGLANTTSESPMLRPDDRVIWLEPVEDVARRTRLWDRIFSGDRASKVLSP